MGKEAALLGITWSSFRVPRILKTGSDFLLLEYVPHSSLQDTAEHGEILGRALSEIHSVKYETSGELNSDLKTEEPLEDLIAVMGNYALGFLDQPSLAPLSNLKDSFKAFLSSQGEALRQMSLPPVLIHGDFKASNLHRAENNQPLVLDWEFAYAGPAWMDIGQLFRWSPSEAFKFGFEVGYGTRKRAFPEDWLDWAAAFDLFNLMGLLEKSELGSKRAKDVVGLIQHTFDKFK
jgi:aminoglycoside phosphotransferase (APT) family kinase protein